MPIYRFVCKPCEKEFRIPCPSTVERFMCPGCKALLPKELPTSISSVAKETKDARRGVSHPKGLQHQMKERMSKHHSSHEVAEQIDKHGIDTARRLGWDKKLKRT